MRYQIATLAAIAFLLLPLACRSVPPTVVTPQGQTAYQLEDLVDAVNLLQHEAIQLTRMTPPRLSRGTALKIVQYRRVASRAIDQAIDAGTGKAAALAATDGGLAEVEKLLTEYEKASLAKAIELVRIVLKALS